MESPKRESRAPLPGQEERESKQESERNREEAMLYCPGCNHRLVNRRCKLVCERCGYFMSCADYY
jgi:hypothetical protein